MNNVIAGIVLVIGLIISYDLYKRIDPPERVFFAKIFIGVCVLLILLVINVMEFIVVTQNTIYWILGIFLLAVVYYLWLRRTRKVNDDRLESLIKRD